MTKKQMLSPRKKYDIKLRIYLKTHVIHTHTQLKMTLTTTKSIKNQYTYIHTTPFFNVFHYWILMLFIYCQVHPTVKFDLQMLIALLVYIVNLVSNISYIHHNLYLLNQLYLQLLVELAKKIQ